MSPPPRITFAIRHPVGPYYQYRRVSLDQPDRSYLITEHVPAVGDLIWMWDTEFQRGYNCRVVERSWSFPGYGSVSFPYSSREPRDGPLLDIIVEEATGPYRNQIWINDLTEGEDNDV